MSINFKIPEVEIRESRLGSITGYVGTTSDLCKKSKSGKLCEKNQSFIIYSMY